MGGEQAGTGQAGQGQVWLAVTPVILLFLLAFVFIVHEELFEGARLLVPHPVDA